MKNITVSLDDGAYRRARVLAAERNTSVSALVRDYLAGLGQERETHERLLALERELRGRVRRFRGGDRLERARLHERGRAAGARSARRAPRP